MKPLLFTLSLVVFSFQVSGQEPHVHFFNELGLSVNYTFLDDLSSLDEPGFGLGIFHVHDFTKNIALAVGLEYNLTRFSTEDKYSKYEHLIDATYSLNYMSIPLMLRFSFGNNCKFLVEGGAYFENYLYSSVKGTHITHGPPGTNSVDTGKFYDFEFMRLFNYGYIVNVGVQIPLGNYKLLIKPGFVYGLENNNRSTQFDHEYRLFNRYAKLSVVIKL